MEATWMSIGRQMNKKVVVHTHNGIFSSVQSLSHVWLFETPWIAACQASLSITNSRSLSKFISIESVIPSNHLILCCPLLLLPSIFPTTASFPVSQLFTSGGQSIGISASTSVLPMNTQDRSPLGWTGWISLQIKGLSRVFSNYSAIKRCIWISSNEVYETEACYTEWSKSEREAPIQYINAYIWNLKRL